MKVIKAVLKEKLGYVFQEFLPNNNEPSPQRYFNRNKRIAEECDILIAFDMKIGHSGTKNTIGHAKELGKKVIIIESDAVHAVSETEDKDGS